MADNKDFWKDYFSDDSYETGDTGEDDTKIIPTVNEDAPMKGAEPVPDVRNDPAPANDRPLKKSGKTDDFEVDFDFDGEYRDVPEERPFAPRREKRTGCIGGLLYGVFIICVSLIAASFLWMAAVDVLALGKPDSEVVVTIPDAAFYDGKKDVTDDDGKVIGEEDVRLADLDDIAEIMYDNGLIKYKGLFKLFCRFCHADEKVGPGTFTLNTKYDYRALVSGTTPGSAQLVEVSVMIPEGYTLKQIFAHLEEEEICSAEELWDAAANYAFEDKYEFLAGIPETGDKYRLEGFLFPDTYYFYMDDDPVRVIKKFLDNFELKFGEKYIERAAEMGYSIRDIVIIASMIEREASSYEGERDLIASVIYNRINSSNFSRLQIDATILYGMARNGDEDKSLSTEYDSPYNTYQHEGLPPGPISNPGEASIRGALYPESTNYYYYALHKGDGTSTWHEFFTNYDSFLNFINSDNYGG